MHQNRQHPTDPVAVTAVLVGHFHVRCDLMPNFNQGSVTAELQLFEPESPIAR